MRILPCALLLLLLGLFPGNGAGADRTITVFAAAAKGFVKFYNSPDADRAFARSDFIVVPRSP